MSDELDGLEELRARVAAGAGGARGVDAVRAAGVRLDAVLDLIEAGRGSREAGSGLNPVSSELLVADALLTDAVADAAAEGVSLADVLAALDAERLARRARQIDESLGERVG